MNRSCLGVVIVAAACADTSSIKIGNRDVGEACAMTSDCKAGQTCEADVCTLSVEPSTGPQRGDACDDDSDCAPDLYCGTQDVCTVTQGKGAGETCGLAEDCGSGLVCHGNDSICVDPADTNGSGVKDLDESCSGLTDCRRPYVCSILIEPNICTKLPFYAGPDCSRTDDEAGLFRVYYELPPEVLPTDEPYEFHRLPYPNDVRVSGSTLDLAGHPQPGAVFGTDIAGATIAKVQENFNGFAINGPIVFHLTDPPQTTSLCLDAGGSYPDGNDTYCAGSGDATVYLVNIDPDSENYNAHIPVAIAVSDERGQYLCQNTLTLAPLEGEPLEHGTTYAAVLTTGLRDVRDDAPIQDYDFARMLDGDADLGAEVLAATAPLRAWVAAQSIDANALAAVAVFTTGEPMDVATRLRAAVYALPAPTFDAGAFDCAAPDRPTVVACHGVVAPGGTEVLGRGCPSQEQQDLLDLLLGSAGWSEIHGTYQGPVFQQGTRPYFSQNQGGEIPLDADPIPAQAMETMCYALTVPKGAAPAGGWPVVIYMHGFATVIGANYRGFADLVAPAFNGLQNAFTEAGFAVIGIDNVLHGPRQDANVSDPSQWSPSSWDTEASLLFFNFLNPVASRDNLLQGTADLFYLTRLLQGGGPSVGGTAVAINPDQIYLFAESLGTVVALPYLALETSLRGAVLSGPSSEFGASILTRTEPIDFSVVAGAFFLDQGLSRLHPIVGLMMQLYNPTDGISFGPSAVIRPDSNTTLPLLILSGQSDNFTPNSVQNALIKSMGIPLLEPVLEEIDGVDSMPQPYVNAVKPAAAVQLSAVQYNGIEEGHVAYFLHTDADDYVKNFLKSARQGQAVFKK